MSKNFGDSFNGKTMRIERKPGIAPTPEFSFVNYFNEKHAPMRANK